MTSVAATATTTTIITAAEASDVVQAVGWDISLGVANTKVGRFFLKVTSADKSWAPDSIEHVGIKAFGHIYEYGDWGILKTKTRPDGKLKSRYPAGKLKNLHNLGRTRKTEEEWEAWIAVESKGDFRGSQYDVVTKSCLVWAISACEFLGVPYPPNWDKIKAYAKKNRRIATALGASIMSSRASSSD